MSKIIQCVALAILLAVVVFAAKAAEHAPPAPDMAYTLEAAMILLAVTALAMIKAAEYPPASYAPDVTYTLKTAIAESKLVYIGVGGKIAGAVNPTLRLPLDTLVQIVLINDENAECDIAFPDFKVRSEHLHKKGARTALVFRVDKSGTFIYFCTLPGHRRSGMEGEIIVGRERPKKGTLLANISADPLAMPASRSRHAPVGARVRPASSKVTSRSVL